ncbi:MAG: serine hydrolase [Bacillus sp. (in: firmicutes)]
MNFLSLEKNIATLIRMYKEEGHIGITIEWNNKKIEYNSQDMFPSASLIKLPIVVEVVEQAKTGQINMQQQIKNAELKVAGGAGIVQSLSKHSSLTIKDLATLMIIVSDNMAANFLMDVVGKENINDRCEKIGMPATKLKRKMMDAKARENGIDNVTTPLDILNCLKKINKDTLLLDILKQQQFRDKIPGFLKNNLEIQVANKTGELDLVEHDCAIITYKKETIYVSVLTEQFPTNKKGKEFIQLIGRCIFDWCEEEGGTK